MDILSNLFGTAQKNNETLPPIIMNDDDRWKYRTSSMIIMDGI